MIPRLFVKPYVPMWLKNDALHVRMSQHPTQTQCGKTPPYTSLHRLKRSAKPLKPPNNSAPLRKTLYAYVVKKRRPTRPNDPTPYPMWCPGDIETPKG